MARGRIPNPLERRHLLARELTPSAARAIADAYLAGDRVPEAVEFLAKADAEAELVSLREQAIAAGDLFLFRHVAQLSGREPEREEWSRLADGAAAAGKLRYEAEARRQSERGEG